MHLNYSTICGAAICHELVKRKKSGLEVVNPDKFEVFWGQIRPLGDRGKCAASPPNRTKRRFTMFPFLKPKSHIQQILLSAPLTHGQPHRRGKENVVCLKIHVLRGETGRRLIFCKTAHFAKPSQCQRSCSAITHGTCILYHFPDFPANPAKWCGSCLVPLILA